MFRAFPRYLVIGLLLIASVAARDRAPQGPAAEPEKGATTWATAIAAMHYLEVGRFLLDEDINTKLVS